MPWRLCALVLHVLSAQTRLSAKPNAKASLLVIGDWALWLWRLADERWPQAQRRLDYYHAVQQLMVVGRALWGEDHGAHLVLLPAAA